MSAHAEFLRAASNNKELASQIKTDFRQAKLPERDFRMLEFVEKLTQIPWLLVESDIRLLRRTGFSDSEILHIVLGSAHFNYLNRMADGIGIRFEYKSDIPQFEVPADSRAPGASTTPVQPASSSKANRAAWIDFPETKDPEPRGDEPSNLFKVLAENPPVRDLAREWRDYQLRGTAILDARKRAQIALFVSGLNRCGYSASWFGKRLRELGASELECQRLAEGKPPDSAAPVDSLVFEHAERLTREPWTTRESHIQELRKNGLDDHAILQLTMLCSYLSFENRVALGLGLALEEQIGKPSNTTR